MFREPRDLKIEKEEEETLPERIHKTMDEIRGAMESYLYQGYVERNFTIEIGNSQSEAEIILIHKETGEKIDLRDFLPPGYKFKKDKQYLCDKDEKEVGFINDPDSRGFLLALFHEIGHSHQKSENIFPPSKSFMEEAKILIRIVTEKIKSIKIRKRTNDHGKKVYKVFSIPLVLLLPKPYLDEMEPYKVRRERDACAYSLRELRKLKEKGYDVFKGFEDVSSIKEYIACVLYTHELMNLIRRAAIGDKEGFKESRENPKFLKREAPVEIPIDDLLE